MQQCVSHFQISRLAFCQRQDAFFLLYGSDRCHFWSQFISPPTSCHFSSNFLSHRRDAGPMNSGGTQHMEFRWFTGYIVHRFIRPGSVDSLHGRFVTSQIYPVGQSKIKSKKNLLVYFQC